MNHAQDQGDEVHDEAVKDRHQAHFDTAGQDIARDIFGIALNEIGHLKVAQERPENAHHQSGEPISLTQAGAFQAAKNRPIKRMVMMIIPTGPPETKRVKRSVRGYMAKTFLQRYARSMDICKVESCRPFFRRPKADRSVTASDVQGWLIYC